MKSAAGAAGSRLPPLKVLARSAGVSHAVMSAAIAQLRQAGLLDVRQRRGIVVAGGETANAAGQWQNRNRWHQLAGELRRDLADGLYGLGPLPAQKEMLNRYRVSQKTLVKALATLAGEGTLAPSGNTYRLHAPQPQRAKNTIVLFARGLQTGEVFVASPRFDEQFISLERVCRARNVLLRIVPCYYTDIDTLGFPGWKQRRFGGMFDPQRVLGFMIWRTGLGPPNTFAGELATALSRFGRPLALYCENASDMHAEGLPAGPRVRRFSSAMDTDAGAVVARVLLSRGHRRICCWCDNDELDWARDRWEGMCRVYRDAGLGDGVRLCSAFGREHAVGSAYWDGLGDFLKSALQKKYAALGVSVRPKRIELLGNGVYEQQMHREVVYDRLLPMMRQALLRRTETAWVGLNDAVALECLDFLQENRVHVPREISVAGFDDSFDAAKCQLTSFNFNGAAAVNRMVDFLLWPNSPLSRAGQGGLTKVDGFVHERTTTGRARGR
jgi:DNA-binding GntR family transcriptional regulator